MVHKPTESKKNANSAVEPAAATPDRTNCPPDAKVRALASGELSDESIAEHVRTCSLCAEEFRDHERDLEWNRFIKRSSYGFYVVIVVIIIVEVLRRYHH